MFMMPKALLVGLALFNAVASAGQAAPKPDKPQGGGELVQTVASRYFPEAAIRSWNGQKFSIRLLWSLDRYDTERVFLENWIQSRPGDVMALQAAIRANKALANALRAKAVQLNNIGAVSATGSGNLIFYLK